MYSELISFIRKLYQTDDFIPLHEPRFWGNEKKYVAETIDSTFVSSVGKFVDQFENMVAEYVGAKYAVATVNGTAALHIGLKLVGVEAGDEVISQPLTFVATCNAIKYCNATPVFIDVDCDTMGLSPIALEEWLDDKAEVRNGECVNIATGNVIRACVPMHVFGHPVRISEIKKICDKYCISLLEDAAESLGSYVGGQHTGTFGKVGIFSFNGNKIITTGGGGMIVTNDEVLAKKAKHITTTAKMAHSWNYEHDELGYNYRLPNLNAALGCAQMENLSSFVDAKRKLAECYANFFHDTDISFVTERATTKSNYWLNVLILKSPGLREDFLKAFNSHGVMARPIWTLMNKLQLYSQCQKGNLENAKWLSERVINIPSSVIEKFGRK